MAVFLGLDGGGSTLRALAIDDDGRVVHRGQSGAANLASTPSELLRMHIAAALAGCPTPDSVYGAFAGAIDTATETKGRSLIANHFPDARCQVGPDARAALRACPEGTQVAVLAGTGSLVCSEDARGFHKSGGNGYLLGDEGSGYRYGLAVLRHYLRETDPTLEGPIEEVFGSRDPGAVVAALYRAEAPARLVARLLPAFVEQRRSQFARRALSEETDALALLVENHAARYLPQSAGVIEVGLIGGVWKSSPVFAESLAERLGVRYHLRRAKHPPVAGAVALAKELFQHGHRI